MGTLDDAKRRPPAGQTNTLLSVAAQSIAATSGVAATVVDVVHGRALEHYGQGLRQYLVVRLGSAEVAGAAFGELRATVTAQGADAMVQPPGVRANLYREARRIARRRLAESGPAAGGTLPWRPPRRDSAVDAEALHRLRSELPDSDAELLELRHARELAPEEVAHVVETPIEVVGEHLEAAEDRARALLDPTLPEEALPRVLLETFALEGEDGGDGVGEVDRAALPAGTVIGGRYAVERRVGSGAFGDVYRANDTEVPGHVVALKLLHQAAFDEAARDQALRELHLIASVFHPSIVQFKDHGWHENRLWFVMPWYDGETLEERIGRAPLSRAEARRIFEPLARALATMHAAGIRHQDVKPDNIFLARIRGFGLDEQDQDVLPVLIDLGVAAKEAEMVVAGTPNYFAPEVAAQFAAVPARHAIGFPADVFSLALSLRNALDPETQEDVPAGAVEAFIDHRAREMPDPPTGRELQFLEPTFRRWLSGDPADRPTADELADELAVLTRPEERRRRIVALLRWLLPLLVTLAVVFTSVVYVLNERAEHQEMEAERQRMMATGLREDLQMSEEQRRSLEDDVSSLRDRYEQGQLTRKQLAEELARAETQLGLVRSRLGRSEREVQGLSETLKTTRGTLEETRQQLAASRDELAATRTELEGVRGQLAQARADLDAARERRRGLEEQLAGVRGELETAQRDARQARDRTDALQARVASLERDVAAEKARATRLEREVAQAEAARRRAEARADRLERRLARLQARRGGGRRQPGGGGAEEPAEEGGTGEEGQTP